MNNGHHTKSLLRGKEPEPVYESRVAKLLVIVEESPRHPVTEFGILLAKLALAIAVFCAIALTLAYLPIG
jgi:hypothetical protein